MRIKLLVLLLLLNSPVVFAQVYPAFGPEIKVTITGLTFDAMEPFISSDGNTLFFNSLNSGGNTNLYYATRVNDSTFTYVGLVGGCYDSSSNHLDGVASLDSLNNFFWVSLRNYPIDFDNLHRGIYASGVVTNITRVRGDFNIHIPGWLIMDAAIADQGNELYYCNAFFNNCASGLPCQARLGVAQKVNDSTFNKLSNTDGLFSNINDTNYIIYAPQVTRDGLELYFTRILNNTLNTEICVAVRANVSDTFSVPHVIHSNLGFVPEAASPTKDKQRIYYHQKDGSSLYKIYLRYRTGSTGLNELDSPQQLVTFPNPTHNILNIQTPNTTKPFTLEVYDVFGKLLLHESNKTQVDLSNYPAGQYFILLRQEQHVLTTKIVKW